MLKNAYVSASVLHHNVLQIPNGASLHMFVSVCCTVSVSFGGLLLVFWLSHHVVC